MIIQVNKKWRIDSDSENWIVQRATDPEKAPGHLKRKSPNPNPNWRDISYHGTLQGAVNSLFERGCRMMDVSTADEIQESMDLFKSEIKSALRVFEELGSLV